VPHVRPSVRGPKMIRFKCFSLTCRGFAGRYRKSYGGASPDFLWRLLALANFMRLSLMKAAHADLFGAMCRKSGVAPSFSAHVRLGERGAPVLFP